MPCFVKLENMNVLLLAQPVLMRSENMLSHYWKSLCHIGRLGENGVAINTALAPLRQPGLSEDVIVPHLSALYKELQGKVSPEVLTQVGDAISPLLHPKSKPDEVNPYAAQTTAPETVSAPRVSRPASPAAKVPAKAANPAIKRLQEFLNADNPYTELSRNSFVAFQIEGEHGFGKPEPRAYLHAMSALESKRIRPG